MQPNIQFHKKERGQSFMEFAVSLTFLLILLAAAADLGSALFTMIALRDVAQEGSVYGSICPDRLDLVKERIIKSATAPLDMADVGTPGDPNSSIEICIVDPSVGKACGAPIELGNSVMVTVTVQHRIVTPFVGSFIGTQEYPLSATQLNTILRTKCYD